MYTILLIPIISISLLTYETLTGDEIENLVNKNIYPANKEDLKEDEDNQENAKMEEAAEAAEEAAQPVAPN